MKKIILMFALLMGIVVSANAQTALTDNGTFKDNWYVGIGVGTNVWNDGNSWTLFSATPKVEDGKTNSWWRTQPLHVNVTVGKMLNPYFGIEADYNMLYNLRGESKFLDAHNLTGNFVFNLNNIVNGYHGYKRFFEVELLAGAGWYHNFNDVDLNNALTVRGALRANFKLSKQLALTLTPEYIWTPKKYTNISTGLQGVNLAVGVKYVIPSSRGGFPQKALRSQAEIDSLNAKINTLLDVNSNLSKANADLAETVKILTEKEAKNKANTVSIPSITFQKGKADVDASQIEAVANALKNTDGKITLVGSTSPEGTEAFNKKLAAARAESVKKALVNAGIDESRITIDNAYDKQRSVTIATK